jgi:hypothetical protein
MLNSLYGKVEAEIIDRKFAPALTWDQESQILKLRDEWHFIPCDNTAGFGWKNTRTGIRASAPHWSLLIATIVLSSAPWIKPPFRLRTLLIATTLVAVPLGIIAALM